MTRIRWRGMVVGAMGLGAASCNGSCCRPSGGAVGSATTGSAAPTGSTALPPTARTRMTHNEGPHNGLTPCALTRNANLLDTLRENELSDATLSRPEVTARLADQDTRGLLQYIVSCALDADSPSVSAPVPPATTSSPPRYMPPWKGEMGLCGRASAWKWSASGPDEDCQEAVTACVVARINKEGKRVVISVRGEPASLLPLQERVDVETRYRESPDADIASLLPCTSATDASCGFSARYVGRCVSRSPETGPTGPNGRAMVTLTLLAPPSGGEVVRACRGLYACRPGDKGEHFYSEWLADGAPGGAVSFECPANGPVEGSSSYGYYSVLVKGSSADVKASSGKYPAPETEVFTYREGAFYGNFFRTAHSKAALKGSDPCAPSSPAAPPKMFVGDQFACYSEIWSDALAHFNDRWCAGTSCFENVPEPCLFVSGSTTALAPGRACRRQTTDPQPFYQLGRGGIPDPATFHWNHPITVYLNHPCDFADKASCDGWKGPFKD